MAKPHSLTTRLRTRLTAVIDPQPDKGEAWCVDCTSNDGRTLLLSADGVYAHMRAHTDGHVRVKASWPRSNSEEEQ